VIQSRSVNHFAFGPFTFWVQRWVQPNRGEWLPVSCKRHQMGRLDFQLHRLLTEGCRFVGRSRNYELVTLFVREVPENRDCHQIVTKTELKQTKTTQLKNTQT